ncbi:MAG: branched-chain amino acid ABC transporter permease [Candidatus Bathyarchaeota archaeon]|nr:branched-chain amino acid ABC transporter permease [Candidatus Bathyarchaeota archaeon]
MAEHKRRKLAAIAFVVLAIAVAAVLTWTYSLGPVESTAFLTKIKKLAVFGSISGSVFALLALGFTLIYGVADVVNMSHGAFYMLGAYAFSVFLTYLGFHPLTNRSSFLLFAALILAAVFIGLVGVAVYRLLIHPIIEDTLSVLVVTIGVTLMLHQIMLLMFGDKNLPVRTLLEGTIKPFGVTLVNHKVLSLVLSLSLIAIVWIFIARSKIGGAMRAAAQDREVAMLMGINTERLYMLTMAISASLAAIAGILLSPPAASPVLRDWTYPLVMSFAIVIVGGLGSIKGSLVGAFIIGFAEEALRLFFPGGSFLKGAIALIVMVVVLILRPKGLFGKRVEAE